MFEIRQITREDEKKDRRRDANRLQDNVLLIIQVCSVWSSECLKFACVCVLFFVL